MTNMKSTKRALLSSVLALFLCFAMLIGTTYAWFTDSVTSSNNVIQSGTLKIAFDKWDADTKEWVDAKDTPIFNYTNWEPGYTEIVNLRVVNKGSLALKWQAVITTEQELSELADVINVYVRSDDRNDSVRDYIDAITDREDYETLANEGQFKKFTLRQFIENLTVMTQGTLEPNQESYLGIVLQMDCLAGNEYQGLDLGGKFDLTILATQQTYEFDSIDDQYDLNAAFDAVWGVIADTSWYNEIDTEFVLDSNADLAGLAKLVNTGVDSFAGKSFKLASNVNLNNQKWFPIGTKANPFKGSFDGNNNTVSNVLVETNSSYAGLFGYTTAGVSVSNLTINNVVVNDATVGDDTTCYGAVIGYCTGAAKLENINVTGNIQITGEWYVGGIIGRSNASAVKNCSVIGEDGSVIESYRWAGGISGYDNGKHETAQCHVENITVKTQSFAGGLLGLSGKTSVIHNNSVKDVEVFLVNAATENAMTYGAILGGACVYNWDNSYFTAYDNTVENVTCIVNGETVVAREMGTKYPENNDYGVVKAVNMRVGNVYFTSLKAALKYAPAGEQVVIELLDDVIVPSNFKPEVAKNQNILIKTNGHDLLYVKVDTKAGKPETDANGDLITTLITAENMSSYITVKAGGAIVIE